jgi:paraquat-inducible protein B
MRASPTAIGAFTLGAVVLALAALVALGGGRFFTRHMRAVAYFTDDLQGLSVGSPVDFRGVRIGRVAAIEIHLDVVKMNPVIPVYMDITTEFDIEDLKGKEDGDVLRLAREQRLKVAIAHGLHAHLATQSLVTGLRFVELNLEPDAPRDFVGGDPSTVEIPTSPSDLTQLQNALSRLPIDQIGESLSRLLGDADRLIASPEIPALLHALVASSDKIDRFLDSTGTELGPLVANANETVKTARDTLLTAQSTLLEARTTFATGNRVMSTDLDDTLKAATGALQKAQKALADADGLLAANSPERYDFDQSLQNLSATTRALRLFSQDLERRPNAILLGK